MVDCNKVCRRHLTFSGRWRLPQATIHVINVCPTAMFNLYDSLRSGYHPAECLLRIQIMLPDMHPLPRFCGRPNLLLRSPGCRSGPLRACMRLHGTEQNHPSRAGRKSSSSTYVQSLLGKESRRNTPIPSHYSTSWCSQFSLGNGERKISGAVHILSLIIAHLLFRRRHHHRRRRSQSHVFEFVLLSANRQAVW